MATKVDSTVLVREPLVVPKPDNLRAKVAQKAEKLFGYKLLKTNMHLAEALGAVLVKLDLLPFNRATVDAYKASKVTKKLIKTDWRGQHFRQTQWKRIEIEDYTSPIPEFVLNKAVQIKEALPNVQLFIEELHTTNMTKAQKRAYRPDPFLIARLGQEEHYIEVWDEPKFEGRMTMPVRTRKVPKAKK